MKYIKTYEKTKADDPLYHLGVAIKDILSAHFRDMGVVYYHGNSVIVFEYVNSHRAHRGKSYCIIKKNGNLKFFISFAHYRDDTNPGYYSGDSLATISLIENILKKYKSQDFYMFSCNRPDDLYISDIPQIIEEIETQTLANKYNL